MQSLNLCGDWQLMQVGRGPQKLSRPVQAVVPGCVHTDLQTAGAIEDPYRRDNELRLAWIAQSDWEYRRRFEVPPGLLDRDRVLLRCDGLDTLAEVRINGRTVGSADNQFRTWEFDVKRALRPGPNEIAVRFRSVLAAAKRATPQQRRFAEQSAAHFKLPGGERFRKAACNFGWDWGPKLVTCGIWRPLRLVGFDTARLANVRIQQNHRGRQVTLAVELAAETVARTRLRAEMRVSLDGKCIASQRVVLRRGRATAEMDIRNPRLWWPAGLGDQPLYDVTVRLLDYADEVLDEQSRRVGLRTVELVRRKDAWGECFHFAVNGRAIFAKGANWIPADTFAPRVTREDYARLLGDAAAANMNMLRVWGGGCYEDDAFYDRCDELGLLVWQDFMFANNRYPLGDAAFLANCRAEAVDNIRRIRHHACLALWCGNNELELLAPRWGKSYCDEHWKFFKGLLRRAVARENPATPYWPGSPHGGKYNDPNQGDAHTWDVWHGRHPFEWYREAMHRFCSEFGFQSFPAPRTVDGYTEPRDRNITSPVMELHQKCPRGNGNIVHYMLSWFRMPKDFDSTLIASQILQALAVEYAVTHWRRHRPRCMGALYWQLNDCWPAASWSSIDYRGRWKALHHAARRFFAPLLLSAVEDADAARVDLHVSNDRPARIAAEAKWITVTLDGKTIGRGAQRVSLAPGTSRRVVRVSLADAAEKHGWDNVLLFAELFVGGRVASRTMAALVKPKQMELGKPQIDAAVKPAGDGEFRVTLKSDRPALWVYLELQGAEAKMSDNFFHLAPRRAISVTVRPAKQMTPAAFKRAMTIRSLADLHSAE